MEDLMKELDMLDASISQSFDDYDYIEDHEVEEILEELDFEEAI